jgi:subtilisin family serine protease
MSNLQSVFYGLLFLPCFLTTLLAQEQSILIQSGMYQGSEIEYITNEIHVKFFQFQDTVSVERITNMVQGSALEQMDSLRWVKIRLNGEMDALEAVETISTDSAVELAVPVVSGHTLSMPNDPYFSTEQWYLKNTGQGGGTPNADIKAVEASGITQGSSNIVMAILDTGIPIDSLSGMLSHPELDDTNRIIIGPDFSYHYLCPTCSPRYGEERDSTSRDELGHGTGVTGLAGAETNNSEGIAGVAPNAKILVIQIAGKNRFGKATVPAEAFYDGVVYAVNYKVNHPGVKVVINASVGFLETNSYLENAVEYAFQKNVIIVAAAGNKENIRNINGVVEWPAIYSLTKPNVIAVGATNFHDGLTSLSVKGNALNIVAPGGDIIGGGPGSPFNDTSNTYRSMIFSTEKPSTYSYKAGSSFAAPLVTGTVALILSLNPSFFPNTIRNFLQTTADDKGPAGWDQEYGFGRLNAYRALIKVITPPLNQPSNNIGVTSLLPVCSWFDQVSIPMTYKIQISTDTNFTTIVFESSNINGTSINASGLMYHTGYYWRVGAMASDTLFWSERRKFYTPSPPAPHLISPGHATNIPTSIILKWSSVPGNVTYKLQVSKGDFSNSFVNVSGLNDTTFTLSNLDPTTSYFWRVSAYNINGIEFWSVINKFCSSPPPAPVLFGLIRKITADELYAKPTWSFSGCNVDITYKLYKYYCDQGGIENCVPVECGENGSLIYSGSDTSYVDYSYQVGPENCNSTTHYYVTATAVGFTSPISNRVMYGSNLSYTKQDADENTVSNEKPTTNALLECYPNPFNPLTVIRYQLSDDANVRLNVFNTLGEEVATLVNEFQSAGYKSVEFNASTLPSGVYFYRLTAGSFTDMKKMLLAK